MHGIPIKCPNCEHVARCNSDMEKHFKMRHIDPCTLKCSSCDFYTASNQDLDAHITSKHGTYHRTRVFSSSRHSHVATTTQPLPQRDVFRPWSEPNINTRPNDITKPFTEHRNQTSEQPPQGAASRQ